MYPRTTIWSVPTSVNACPGRGSGVEQVAQQFPGHCRTDVAAIDGLDRKVQLVVGVVDLADLRSALLGEKGQLPSDLGVPPGGGVSAALAHYEEELA